MSAVEQVKAWQREWQEEPGKHWGDSVAWGTAIAIAQRLDDEGLTVPKRWRHVIPLVEHITIEEGACVSFTGGNPDFNGLPNEAVTVTRGDAWEDEIFTGDTLAECLEKATEETPDVKD